MSRQELILNLACQLFLLLLPVLFWFDGRLEAMYLFLFLAVTWALMLIQEYREAKRSPPPEGEKGLSEETEWRKPKK